MCKIHTSVCATGKINIQRILQYNIPVNNNCVSLAISLRFIESVTYCVDMHQRLLLLCSLLCYHGSDLFMQNNGSPACCLVAWQREGTRLWDMNHAPYAYSSLVAYRQFWAHHGSKALLTVWRVWSEGERERKREREKEREREREREIIIWVQRCG